MTSYSLFFSSPGQLDSKKVRFIVPKAIFTFIITFITFTIHGVINVIFGKYWSFGGFLIFLIMVDFSEGVRVSVFVYDTIRVCGWCVSRGFAP
jgi:hypothetical protein